MSEFLDELARSLAKPMPRSRAVRLLGSALLTAAVPGALRTAAGHARRSGSGACPPAPNCNSEPNTNLCTKPVVGNDGCTRYIKACCPRGGGDPQPKCCVGDGRSGGVKCCRPCEDCFTGGGEPQCLKNKKRSCGTECCPEGQFCGSPKHNLCCREGDSLSRSGRHQSAEIKCVGSNGARCCPEGTTCCQGKNCCWPGQRCVNGRCVCSPKQTVKCGSDCCDPETEKCCFRFNGRRIQHCAPKDEVCCGTGSCPKGVKCCGGVKCAGGPGDDWECCGTQPYNAAEDQIGCCGGVVCHDDDCVCDADPEEETCYCDP